MCVFFERPFSGKNVAKFSHFTGPEHGIAKFEHSIASFGGDQGIFGLQIQLRASKLHFGQSAQGIYSASNNLARACFIVVAVATFMGTVSTCRVAPGRLPCTSFTPRHYRNNRSCVEVRSSTFSWLLSSYSANLAAWICLFFSLSLRSLA